MLTILPTFAETVTTAPATPVGHALYVIFAIIGIALVFDFLNGFHDAANSIATIVSTRVLTPGQAVLWAAFFNFGAAFVFGTKVSGTVADGLVEHSLIDVNVVAAGLIGAIVWNVITWLLALPTSSSHALFGGIGGAAVLKSGVSALKFSGWSMIILGIFLAPILGFLLGILNMTIVSWLIWWAAKFPGFVANRPALKVLTPLAKWVGSQTTPHRVDRIFRKLQLVSAAFYSLGHGGNDAQKTMGVIVMLLSTAGMSHLAAPNPGSWLNKIHLLGGVHNTAWWIILSCNFAIALGTCFGGWRIVKTMGSGITRLQPIGGFCAEAAAAMGIFGFTLIKGVPISTTHAITGSILGVGTTRSVRSVRWIWGQRIIIAWVLTIPCAAFVSGVAYILISQFMPL